MRILRSLAVAGVLAALVPAAAQAQTSSDGFTNSWFWGAKGGLMTFSTTDVKNAAAPLVGAEWLITRQRGALYLSFDQAYFEETAGYTPYDSIGMPLAGEGRVTARDMRRFTAALYAFPKPYGALRPYAGVGVAVNMINSAEDDGTAPAGTDAENSIDYVQSRGAFIATLGTQMQLSRVAVFGQASWMPARTRFLFSGASTYFLEAGVRYNIGSSVER